MACPVYRNEARVYTGHCAKCAVYVYEKCWQRHVRQVH